MGQKHWYTDVTKCLTKLPNSDNECCTVAFNWKWNSTSRLAACMHLNCVAPDHISDHTPHILTNLWPAGLWPFIPFAHHHHHCTGPLYPKLGVGSCIWMPFPACRRKPNVGCEQCFCNLIIIRLGGQKVHLLSLSEPFYEAVFWVRRK